MSGDDKRTGFQPDAFRPQTDDRGLLKVFRPAGKPVDLDKPVDLGGAPLIDKRGKQKKSSHKRGKS